MPLLFALAVSIGALGVVATWLFLGPIASTNAQVWQAFVAWACFYHCGGSLGGVQKTVTGMIFGAAIGAASVLLAGELGVLGGFAAPVAVGIGAAVIVLAAHLGLLATIPVSVYGFAAIAGLILLKGVTPVNALLPTILSVLIGAAFGWASEWIGGKLARTAAPA